MGKRSEARKKNSISELEKMAKSGSLSAASAQAELNRRTKKTKKHG